MVNKVLFSHLPKTAGMWTIKTLDELRYPTDIHVLIDYKYPKMPIISAIRNPWAWYVSWYNFIVYGSVGDNRTKNRNAFSYIKEQPTFDDVLFGLIKPTQSILHRVNLRDTRFPPDWSVPVHNIWFEKQNPYYQNLYECYTKAVDNVFLVEDSRVGLCECLSNIGVLTTDMETKIMTSPKTNVGKKQPDYKTYYNDRTKKLVADNHKEIIERFNYTF
jgi:hypothetical protein